MHNADNAQILKHPSTMTAEQLATQYSRLSTMLTNMSVVASGSHGMKRAAKELGKFIAEANRLVNKHPGVHPVHVKTAWDTLIVKKIAGILAYWPEKPSVSLNVQEAIDIWRFRAYLVMAAVAIAYAGPIVHRAVRGTVRHIVKMFKKQSDEMHMRNMLEDIEYSPSIHRPILRNTTPAYRKSAPPPAQTRKKTPVREEPKPKTKWFEFAYIPPSPFTKEKLKRMRR